MKLYGSEVYNIPPPATPEDDALARVCVWCAQQDAEKEGKKPKVNISRDELWYCELRPLLNSLKPGKYRLQCSSGNTVFYATDGLGQK